MALSPEEITFLTENFPGQVDSASDSDLSKMFLYHIKEVSQREASVKLGEEPNLLWIGTFKHGLLPQDSAGNNFYVSFVADSAGLIDISDNFISGIATVDSGA